LRDRRVKEVHQGVFHSRRFAPPQAILLPLPPKDSLVVFASGPNGEHQRAHPHHSCCSWRGAFIASTVLMNYSLTQFPEPLYTATGFGGKRSTVVISHCIYR